jgi:hypothetical protein
MAGNENSGQKQFVPRQLTGEVRKLTLQTIKRVLLEEGLSDFKQQVILRLTGQILPRLNEHTGEEGEAIIITVTKEGANKYGISTSDTSDSTGGQAQV